MAVYALFDPARLPFPKCPFKLLTGFSCPGCGSQRATHALLTGDIAGAFAVHPLYVPALLFVVLVVWAKYRRQQLYMKLTGRTSCLVVFAIIVIWWVGRNILGI